MVAVRDSLLQGGELLATVGRFAKVQAAHENIFRIAGIDTNLAVVHRAIVFGAATGIEAGSDDAPGLPFVVRTPDSGFFRIRWSGGRRCDRARSRYRSGGRRWRRAGARQHLLFTARADAGADFDLRIEHVRIRWRNINPDSSH